MNNLKMIIVDDERIILESLETLVDWSAIGVEVVGIADNGAVALDLAALHRPDIILSDISMPSFTGLEMLENLREKQMKVEVIFITAYGKFDYAKEAIKHGAYDYLLKPIDEALLLETVARCANKIRSSELQYTLDTEREVASGHSGNEHSAYSGVKHLVRAAIDYIHDNYHNDISLSQVAEHLYITPAYLSKLFSAEMHESFSRYLLLYRIKTAKELLASTHCKVYEVANKVGYTDVAHFSKLFKRNTGLTPVQYRNERI